MREYGQIQCAFWQSKDAEALSDSAKLMVCYLLTGPHSNGVGCYRLPDGYINADLGWSPDKISKTLDELAAVGFCFRHDQVIVMPGFMRWNQVANGNVAKARLQEWESLPKGQARAVAAQGLLDHCKHLSADQIEALETAVRNHAETVSGTVEGTIGEGYGKQNPTQPERTQPNPTQAISPQAARFDEFWAAYPKKAGKQATLAKWRTRKCEAIADRIIADVKARVVGHRPWLEGFVPNPETYLNGARWEDAIEPPKRGGQAQIAYQPLPGEI